MPAVRLWGCESALPWALTGTDLWQWGVKLLVWPQAPGGTEFWQKPEVVGTGCPAPEPTRHLPQTAVLIPSPVLPPVSC